ncbi:hypothetical protein F4604DRAFT_1939014 [Suillus subluteus]|nr:hypothetical protein F4604DRAFT_1939014 [Suillus subluteus]
MLNGKPVHLNISDISSTSHRPVHCYAGIKPLCLSGAISDLYEVVDAIGSMTIHDIDDLEANLIMDLARVKQDIFNAEKMLADCLLHEHKVMVSLSKHKSDISQQKLAKADVGIGHMWIVFRNMVFRITDAHQVVFKSDEALKLVDIDSQEKMNIVDSVWTEDTENVQDDDERMENEEKFQSCERNFEKKLQNCKRPGDELVPLQQSQNQLESMLEVDVPQFNAEDNMLNVDFDRAHFEDEGELSGVEVYEGAGTCYARDGVTFLDLFDADEYAECRKENLFYPFASREEWEVADFLLCSPLSMAAINQFLELPMIHRLKLSFRNAKELRNRAEMLPKGSSWKDPVECLESLFSNPLFHDQLDFVPHRVYMTSARLLRVYSEWLTGDSAWEIQDQLPRGATVLGTVLSSDKTNITNMTGARVAHPLLLGLANICMNTRTKLSSKAFLLMALLPIPQYLHSNARMRGMLEDRLMHECLSIVLKPLMKAAEIGIMMSDPAGNVRHCFTPLAAYIVNTPEACMLACLDSIKVDPNDLEAYFQACEQYRLNGVHSPFWVDWPLADPSVFLTPEPLHHWHKEFYDHDLQWCLIVVGAQELDFRISILQPTTGYWHFSGGISKLKQVTGRVHRDLQHYIVGLIAGAAPRRFVIVIRALMDVRYMVQSPSPDENLLACIDRSLSIFHENKDIITSLGARMGTKKPIDNWFIPKLELMQSITASTCKVGALIQWSADTTEHAHISEIKDPARHTNNNNYDPQICQEFLDDEVDEENEEDDGDCNEPTDPRTVLLEELNQTHITTNYFSKARQLVAARCDNISHPPWTFVAASTAIHLNFDPTRTGLKIDEVANDFNIPDLRQVLSDFLQRDVRNGEAGHGLGVPRRPLIDRPSVLPFECIQIWHTVCLQQVSFHNASIVLPAQTVHASPPSPASGWPKG